MATTVGYHRIHKLMTHSHADSSPLRQEYWCLILALLAEGGLGKQKPGSWWRAQNSFKKWAVFKTPVGWVYGLIYIIIYIYTHAYTLSNILAMITIHYRKSDLPANIKGPAEGFVHSFEHCSYPQLRAFFTCWVMKKIGDLAVFNTDWMRNEMQA